MNVKTAVLTGASSGLGRALAVGLAGAGYRLALVGRNETALLGTLNLIAEQRREGVKIVLADLTKESDLKDLIERCCKEIESEGALDLLVNNAGVSVSGRVEDIPLEIFDRIWQINFRSPVALVKQALPKMKNQKSAMIVNISSGVAKRAIPYEAPYCAAKAALEAFTESLRIEVASEGIGVLSFSPGPISSGFHAARAHYGKTRLVSPPFRGKEAVQIAQTLIHAIQQRKKRVTLGGRAKFAQHLNYWFPNLTDRLVARACRIEALDAPTLSSCAVKPSPSGAR